MHVSMYEWMLINTMYLFLYACVCVCMQVCMCMNISAYMFNMNIWPLLMYYYQFIMYIMMSIIPIHDTCYLYHYS